MTREELKVARQSMETYINFAAQSALSNKQQEFYRGAAAAINDLLFRHGAGEAVEDLAIRLSVGDDRIEQLRWCFDNETNAPETQEWRERLTEEEADLVEHWQTQYDNGFVKMCSDCVKYATDRD